MLKEYNLSFDTNSDLNKKYILISDAQLESEIKYSLSPFFEKSHRLASYIIKQEYESKFGLRYDPIAMSLYKAFCISYLLPICQLLLVSQNLIDSRKCLVRIDTESVDIAVKIAIHLKILDFVRFDKKKLKLNSYMFFPKIVYKLIIYIFNSIFVKQDKKITNALLCFGSDRFISPYYSDNSIVYPIFNLSDKFSGNKYSNKVIERKFISFTTLIVFFPAFFKLFLTGYKITKSLSKSLELSLNISIEVLLCLSLKRKYKNIANLIGTLDASSSIDAITWFANFHSIKTVVIPHGIPFSFKSPYLSYGSNIYCAWSKFHTEILKRNKFVKENCKIVITGNPIYKKMNLYHLKNPKKISEKINILMILENISDDFCRAMPYQSLYFEQLISSVVSISKSNSNSFVSVRTRNEDKVYGIAKKFEQDVILSSSIETSIEDDINKSDIVITQYSNAINEALIFDKMIIQVDLFQINDWHTEIPNVTRVKGINELKILLEERLKHKVFKANFMASTDLYQFNNCNHNKFKNEN